MRLKGKVALITGAARGQGEAEARMFSREGAKVVVSDVLEDAGRKVAKEISDGGGEALFVKLDVTSEAGWKQAVDVTVKRFGKLDILVNNAAILYTEPVLETTVEIWDRTMDINSTGVFLGTREVIPHMRRNGGGSIVNIASLSANVAGPYAAAYHASKGAVRIFTKAAAIQYAKENIRVNSVHPGPVDTKMIRDAYAESWLKRIDTQSPMGRMASSDEIAYCVLFLASDEASYVTGAELIVDGGWGAQ